jgi:hypothetical protein
MINVTVQRLEMYFVLAVLVIGAGAVGWHEHNARVAQDALLDEQKKQNNQMQTQSKLQIELLTKQIATAEIELAQAQDERQKMVVALSALNNQLGVLQVNERRQVQAVQQMSPDALTRAIADALNIQGAKYNQATQTLTGVTVDDLKKIETEHVELVSCQGERDKLTVMNTACANLNAEYTREIQLQGTIIADQQKELNTTKQADASEIALLKKQVVVVRGSLIHRIWNRIKFPAGVAIGIGVRSLAGI